MTRAEGDSWDLTSSVGTTATAVAAVRAIASQGPDALLHDPLADPLVRAVGIDFFIRMLDGEQFASAEDDPMLNRTAMKEQIAVRTRFFDDFLTASGLTQAVILASGLDTRAYRLAWPDGTSVYELDQPAVIDFKTATLADLGAATTAHRHAVPVDLRDDWPNALRHNGFDPSEPTAWIAEGLLAYLAPDAQDRLFDHITALSVPGSRLATEHIDMAALPDDWAQKLTERSRRAGFTIDRGALFYAGERNSAADYLRAHGWQVGVQTTEQIYAANGFELPDDEMAACGGGSGYLTATRD